MREPVLFVDDDKRILQAFKRRLFKTYDLQIADSAEKALKMLNAGSKFSVIISDQQMPGKKGVDFLREVMTISPLSTRIMLTGNADRQTAVDSVNDAEVFRYLTKPCSSEEISKAIEDGISHHKIVAAEKELLEQTLAGSTKLLVDILSANEPHSFAEVTRLRNMGKQFAEFIGHPKAWELDLAIMLSPIGEVMLPIEVRSKLERSEELAGLEQQMVQDSPRVARDLLLNIPRLKPIAEAVYYKNKNFDGSGYPMDSVKGLEIPVNARILRMLTLLNIEAGGNPPIKDHFSALKEQKNIVDVSLLKLAEKCFDAKRNQVPVQENEIVVKIEELKVGDLLLEDLITESGKLALSANRNMTEALIHKAKQFHTLRVLREPVRILRESEAA